MPLTLPATTKSCRQSLALLTITGVAENCWCYRQPLVLQTTDIDITNGADYHWRCRQLTTPIGTDVDITNAARHHWQRGRPENKQQFVLFFFLLLEIRLLRAQQLEVFFVFQRMEERGSGASHPGAAAINCSPRDVSEQLAENTTLVLQARTVVLGASAAVFGALQRT